MRRRCSILLLAALAATAGSAGCGAGGGGDSSEPTTTTADPEGLGAVEAVVVQLLVTADEVGIDGLQDVGFTPPEGPDACGFDLDATVPPLVLAGSSLSDGARSVTESIRVYDDEAAGGRAYDAAVANACETPVDVNERIQADAAFRVGNAVVAHVRDAVVTVSVTGDVPDLLDIAAFAVGKILAALGA